MGWGMQVGWGMQTPGTAGACWQGFRWAEGMQLREGDSARPRGCSPVEGMQVG